MSSPSGTNLSNRLAVLSGGLSLQQELMAEQAASLGQAGREVETALGKLRDFDDGKTARRKRDDLLADAAMAVWKFFVQREVIGMRDQKAMIAHYAIPGEVLSRLGQQARKK